MKSETLSSEEDKLAPKAENESNFSYLLESNNKKKICTEKQTEISELEKMENDLSKKGFN